MIELPFWRRELAIRDFRAFLKLYGAQVHEHVTQLEVMRYTPRGRDRLVVIQQNKFGRLRWQSDAAKHYRSWIRNEDPFREYEEGYKARPEIILATDASFSMGAGSWGAVLFAPALFDVEASGKFMLPVRSSTGAEARAAANALSHFIRSGDLLPGDAVRLLCDNINVVNHIKNNGNSKIADIAESITHLRTLAVSHELVLGAGWVKGHQQPHISMHARLNVRCDRLAKEAWRAV